MGNDPHLGGGQVMQKLLKVSYAHTKFSHAHTKCQKLITTTTFHSRKATMFKSSFIASSYMVITTTTARPSARVSVQ